METVQIKKSDFSKILSTAEVLIDEVEQAFSQDEVVIKRNQPFFNFARSATGEEVGKAVAQH